MNKSLVALVLTLALFAGLALGAVAHAQGDTVKITVLNTTNFDNLTSYILDASTNQLVDVNTSYVQLSATEMKDLNSSDNYKPVVLLNLDAPTSDLNTNESIAYAWVLSGAYGTAIIGVADINTTDNTVHNLSFYKVSPVSGDIAIIRTSYDIVIEGDGYKLSIPLANYTNPKVLLMTDSDLSVRSLSYVELRALTTPPSGFTLIKQGTGEQTFTISASGTLWVWFDEQHNNGDADLFIFDQSNPSFSEASNSQSWSWLFTHADATIFADARPDVVEIEATGTVKFVVKNYSGNATGWKVAAMLNAPDTNTPATTTQPMQPVTANGQQNNLNGAWHDIQSALGGHAVAFIIIFLLFLLLLAFLLRR